MDNLQMFSWPWWALVITVTFVIWYLFPFFVSPLFKSKSYLWGYRLGVARRKKIEASNLTDLEKENRLKSFTEDEIDRLDASFDKVKDRLEKRIESLDTRLSNAATKHSARGDLLKNSAPSKTYEWVKGSISNQENIKGFILTIIAAVIFIVDTKVASDIFKSFGIFRGSTRFFGVEALEAENVIVYGFILTFILAAFFHVILTKTKVENFFSKKMGKVAGNVTLGVITTITTIAIVFVLRATMLAFPDSSQLSGELLLLLVWVVCIIVLCFVAKYISKNESWVSAFLYPGLFAILLFFGGITLVGFISEFLVTFLIEKVLSIQKSRTQRLIEFNEANVDAQKTALIRGVTS